MKKEDYINQFEIMREIALSASAGDKPAVTADLALRKTAALIGLTAGTMILWDDRFNPILTVTFAENDIQQKLLAELEDDIYMNLRKNRQLLSAYVSFGGEQPISSFTLPVKKGGKILGAVVGLQAGVGSLVKEDKFLETLAAALSVSVMAAGLDDVIEDEKLKAVMATATTVNHRINNPLQAILGIVQLFPRQRPELEKPDDQLSENDRMLKAKLKDIEEAAVKIMQITHQLMRIDKVELTDYIDGTKMLRLPEDNESS
ncbi:MAG TPA: hypothetical protein ENH25_09280 [candidate division Zixibacteria bacterium]|nr:hypothetical protein [candidate division Zixibacteria bacterium]